MAKSKIEVSELGRTVADNVKFLRRMNGLQYKELSEMLAKSGRAIPPLGLRRIESYERRIDMDDLYHLAGAFGLKARHLLENLVADVIPETEEEALASKLGVTVEQIEAAVRKYARGDEPRVGA